jgi:hypothetical protein
MLSDQITLTDVENKTTGLPKEINLYQNYPNPFNPNTIIKYELPKSQRIKIQVFDVIGRLTGTLFEGYQSAGIHEISFDAKKLNSGNYFIKLDAGNMSKTIRVMLLK